MSETSGNPEGEIEIPDTQEPGSGLLDRLGQIRTQAREATGQSDTDLPEAPTKPPKPETEAELLRKKVTAKDYVPPIPNNTPSPNTALPTLVRRDIGKDREARRQEANKLPPRPGVISSASVNFDPEPVLIGGSTTDELLSQRQKRLNKAQNAPSTSASAQERS